MILRIPGAVVFILCAASIAVHADVRSEEKSLVTFEGALGRAVNFFGGRAAKDGVISTVAVKGDRKVTMNDTTGQIVDLGEEKVYDLDLRKKTYSVKTFAQIRKEMEEAREKAAEQAPAEETDAEEKAEPAEKREVDRRYARSSTGRCCSMRSRWRQ